MRKFQAGTRTYYLKEIEYKQLLKRFDLENSIPMTTSFIKDRYTIPYSCICPSNNCKACTLGPQDSNCLRILAKITKLRRPYTMELYCHCIAFDWYSEKSKEYIKTVRDFLLNNTTKVPFNEVRKRRR